MTLVYVLFRYRLTPMYWSMYVQCSYCKSIGWLFFISTVHANIDHCMFCSATDWPLCTDQVHIDPCMYCEGTGWLFFICTVLANIDHCMFCSGTDLPLLYCLFTYWPLSVLFRYRLAWRPSDEGWPAWSGVKQGSDLHFLLGKPFKTNNTVRGGALRARTFTSFLGNHLKQTSR